MTGPVRSYRLPAGAVLVTGGAGGIGTAIVAALAQAGVPVAALDVRPAARPNVLSLSCDVADARSVRDAVAAASADLGPPAGLVCAAGVSAETRLADLEEAEWARVLGVSLTGAYLAMREVHRPMAARGGGAIVAFSSGRARRAIPAGSHYAAAKAGLEGLVRTLAAELAPGAIRVNAVAPGPVRTAMLDTIPGFDEAQRAQAIPAGRIGEPVDLVGPTMFLLGEDSGYVTGQVLQVSGGLVMA